MNRKITMFLIVLCLGCNHPEDKIIIAENIENDALGYITKLVMLRDSSYVLSFIPVNATIAEPHIYADKYSIKKDTIYFLRDKQIKKAILKNGYIEFLDDQFKIKLKGNLTSINSGSELKNYKDFSFFTYNKNFENIFKKGNSADLNIEDLEKIILLIQNQIKKSKYFYRHSDQNEYFKQCISIMNENNEKEVWVNCVAKNSNYSFDRWQTKIIKVHDGGDSYFNIKINLSTGKVYAFSVNGQG